MPHRIREKASSRLYRIMMRKATRRFERDPSLGIRDPAEWRRRVHRELIYLWARNLIRNMHRQNEAHLRRKFEEIRATVDHIPRREEKQLRKYLRRRVKEVIRRKGLANLYAEEFLLRMFSALFAFDRWLRRRKYSIFERDGSFSKIKYLARFDQFINELTSPPLRKQGEKQKHRIDIRAAFEHCVANYPSIVDFANFVYNFLERANKN